MREKALRFAVPILLVLVAFFQMYRAQTVDQSPWAGAGFGMFAAIDGHPTRFERVVLITESGEEAISLPTSARDEALRARVIPSEANATAVARAVLDVVSAERHDVDAVQVQLWGIDFLGDGPSVRGVPIGQTVQVAAG